MFLNQETFPALKHAPKSPLFSSSGQEIDEDTLDFIDKAEKRARYDDDMRLIQLPEVVVSAKKIPKRDAARLDAFPMNAGSDKTIYREEFENRAVTKVSHLLMMVAGVRVESSGDVFIRGSQGPALLMIDGMTFEGGQVDDVVPMDVEAIDIFKGASAAIFGSRGGNGVISITTRRGEVNRGTKSSFNFVSYAPIGYQKPIEYYSPIYDTPELKNLGLPDYRTTIYWKPDLVISDDGNASFDFYTSDFPTTYSVVIEGLSVDGKIIRTVQKIVLQ
jgi:TonB-dependent SusC/RagA subfamily outer membrane receptor